jgi:chromosome segregation ATPase
MHDVFVKSRFTLGLDTMLTFICALSTILFGVVAFLYFKRSKDLQGILAEGAKKFEQQHEELTMVRKRLAAAADAQASLESDLRQMKQTHEVEGARNAKIVGELLNTQATMERKLANAEAQRDHILGKYEALNDEREHFLSERSDSEQLVRTLEAECNRLQNELGAAARKSEAIAATELQSLRGRIRQLEQELANKNAAGTADPKELDAMRRRANQNEQLYLSMKSLREMAEERNKNWETALKKLATWILTSSHLAQAKDPALLQSIGPLVGEALERIGGKLVDGEDSDEILVHKTDNTFSAES